MRKNTGIFEHLPNAITMQIDTCLEYAKWRVCLWGMGGNWGTRVHFFQGYTVLIGFQRGLATEEIISGPATVVHTG